MPSPRPSAPTRVLVIRAGALGDTAYASSIIEPLRRDYGDDVLIDWVAKAGMGRLFAADPRIHRVFELKSRRAPLAINRGKWSIIRAGLRTPYDLIVNLELGSIFDGVLRLTRARRKIGSPYQHFKEPDGQHAVENLHLIYRSFLSPEAMAHATPSLIGTAPATVRERYALPEGYTVLVPSNSHHRSAPERNYRAWPVAHWRDLMQDLAAQGVPAVVIGGAAEQDYFRLLEPLPEGIISLVGRTDFPDLIGLLAGARAVLTTDTGPSHIAAATGTPVYALIGPTDFRRTGPYRTADNEIHIISANLPCSPCYHSPQFDACPFNRCMHEIRPEQVAAALASHASAGG
jgi:ADP-heptose:LPS heptosyltransferase